MRHLGQSAQAAHDSRNIRRNGGEVCLLQDGRSDMEGTRMCPVFRSSALTLRYQQSVRHHLSLNRLFERQPRPATDPGFGSYWTVNLLAPPGTKRPRKRGRPNKEPRPKKNDLVAVEDPSSSSTKPRRGRPRKDEESPLPLVLEQPVESQPVEQLIEPPIETSIQIDDDDEVDMLNYEEENIDELESRTSDQEDECESEETLLHPFERRHSLSGRLTPYDSSGGCHISPHPPTQHVPSPQHIPSPSQHHISSLSPHTSPASISTDTEDIIERLQMEMANLRRQSADAISLSMRLSDQLSHAEAEKAEAQSALEATEMKLRDEIKKRKQAEREALNALSLRQAAEEALKSSQKFQAELPRHAR